MKRIALRMDDKDIMGHDMITAMADDGSVVGSDGRKLRRYVGFIDDVPFYAYYMFGSFGIFIKPMRHGDEERFVEIVCKRLSEVMYDDMVFDCVIKNGGTIKISFYRIQESEVLHV